MNLHGIARSRTHGVAAWATTVVRVVSGGLFHGTQLWVNLPKAEKWAPPRYQDLRATEVSLLATPDAGALVRVIAGQLAGHPGPGITYTPMTYLHATVSRGARLELPWRDEAFDREMVRGRAQVLAERQDVDADGAQVVHRREDLGCRLPETDHQAQLRQRP